MSEHERTPGVIKFVAWYLDPLEVRAVRFLKGTGKTGDTPKSDDQPSEDTVWVYIGNPVAGHSGTGDGKMIATAGGGASMNIESIQCPFQFRLNSFVH